MNQQELQQFITPYDINKGVVVEGDLIEFEIKNNSPYPFLCYEYSCACLGVPEMTDKSLKTSFPASTGGTYASTQQFLKVGDKYVQLHTTQNGPRFYDPIHSEWVPNEDIPSSPDKVPVVTFHQTLTLWLDDGQEFYRINPTTKQLETNPDKNRIVIPVRFLVIKPPKNPS